MMTQLQQLNRQLCALSVFRSILDTPVVLGLQKLIYAIDKGSLEEQISACGAFTKALYEEGGNLSIFVLNYIKDNENVFVRKKLSGETISAAMMESMKADLAVLQKLASLDATQVTGAINYDGYLPLWTTEPVDLAAEYADMLANLATKGYGIFARYRSFKVKDGRLVPVTHADSQTITQLYGYSRERNQVLENTKALASGKGASNVLLYGDAGTGKSSTIKACAGACAAMGVRLIEFDKRQLAEIPALIEQLAESPLKFIFYIDDLSFVEGDDAFSCLKGILEGGVTGHSANIAIYATSNRRHLVKESIEARQGSGLHLNDTLQETMSLSARFGLTITFSKPEKDLYLEIVKSLAKERGLRLEEAELFKRAEAFAIRSNGRSPRTAKQFVQLAKIGLK